MNAMLAQPAAADFPLIFTPPPSRQAQPRSDGQPADSTSRPIHRLACLLLILLTAIFAPILRAEKVQDLKPQGYVNDFAGVLNADSRERISALCLEVQQKTGAQIAVVTIKTLDGQPIEDFANALYQRWGIGPKADSRGVLILMVTQDHKYRFEVGYGLEGILPDGKVGGFGREAVPLLRQNDYSAALYLMTRRVADVIAQDKGVTLEGATPPAADDNDSGGRPAPDLRAIMWLVIIVGWVIFAIIRAIFRMIFGAVPPARTRRFRGGCCSSWAAEVDAAAAAGVVADLAAVEVSAASAEACPAEAAPAAVGKIFARAKGNPWTTCSTISSKS